MSYILSTSTDPLCRALAGKPTYVGRLPAWFSRGVRRTAIVYQRPFLPMAEARGFSGGHMTVSAIILHDLARHTGFEPVFSTVTG